MKPLAQKALVLFATLLVATAIQASSMSQSDLPMSQPNFQGFVPDQRRHMDEREEDPNLIRMMVAPSLYAVTNLLLDTYQEKRPESRFRIHQGTPDDLLDLLDDNYDFDLLLDAEISDGMARVKDGWAVRTQVLAVGRVALWAPLETVRSTRVLSLRNDPIGLQHASSPYHRAGREVLERNEVLEEYENRLTPVRLGESLFDKVKNGDFPAAFIEYHRLVQAGLHERREVLKMPSNHHGSITHSATMMRHGQSKDNVQEFWEFLFSDQAQRILKDAGFD
ncbi:ABC-type molybdate transport system, substrate-binding protein [Marinospirillum celere]|uniref:ABC-type molybdate transport system, substrate-binding protein n=1 Tax=Marinospirillum celere TaxID=1122252 RepID=A0A1I1EBW7_9GAMM|nr:substrate-binding domain-containing protein [Marinospirillum celere]SFB84236.1 ABC-type molybdate transport system, substrate-binding protein [Marinospirillum celere]